MSEMVSNFDVAIRLALIIAETEGVEEYKVLTRLCNDALKEIERLRAENKRLKR